METYVDLFHLEPHGEAIMAMEGRTVTSVEGIIDQDVDQSIRNLTRIGSRGMNETDRLVLNIMTHKS